MIPHKVQELLSAEKTPTVPMVIPAYDRLHTLLKLATKSYPKIAHGIWASIESLEEYTMKTRVYALAMGTSLPTVAYLMSTQNMIPGSHPPGSQAHVDTEALETVGAHESEGVGY